MKKCFVKILSLLMCFSLLFCLISCREIQSEDDYYILNTRTQKIHKSTCGTAGLIIEENRTTYDGEIEDLFLRGYTTCGNCFR